MNNYLLKEKHKQNVQSLNEYSESFIDGDEKNLSPYYMILYFSSLDGKRGIRRFDIYQQ